VHGNVHHHMNKTIQLSIYPGCLSLHLNNIIGYVTSHMDPAILRNLFDAFYRETLYTNLLNIMSPLQLYPHLSTKYI
jgi:hypothetical protein